MHIPVLVDKVIEILDPKPNLVYLDATLGCGGHTAKIFEVSPKSKVIGIDIDSQAIEFSKERLKNFVENNQLIIIKDNFVNIKNILEKLNIKNINGAIFDFGMSTLQLKSNRGFSFNDETLDMRMDTKNNYTTAEYIINNFSLEQLTEIFENFAEEPFSKKIAKAIVEYRKNTKITKACQLKDIINIAVGKKTNIKTFQSYDKKKLTIKINSSTRIFQALRIYINNELENIEKGLNNTIDVLTDSGKIVAISYHSLEDRIVKNIFKKRQDCKVLTKKPLIATFEEIDKNLASRSAKLRAAQKQSNC
ncbi:MAG: 16S rRNA (cytosine(1402)-N(4))-methyltransferase RsmH [Endomicrobia bacterium]|nr:16S rRNA (cytosine(1402)-N(4))-methyltransferase RsmH [Endomicrobiia bacterium]